MICNTFEINSGEFALDGGFRIPSDQLKLGLEARVGVENVSYLNASKLAERMLGDAIFSTKGSVQLEWSDG